MTAEQNKQLAARYFEEFWNQNKLGVVDEIVSADVSGHVAGNTFQGAETLKQRAKSLRKIYSEVHFAVEDQIGEGDKSLVRWSFRGKHTGEYLGARPTGKAIETTGMNLFRCADGRIAEIWVEADDLGELQQLGIVSLPG